MEKQLNNLDQKEHAIIETIKSIIGSIEIKANKIKELGIFELYANIHNSYTNMDSIEALKRSIFIQWYGSFEPSIYTGIDILNSNDEIKNLDKLVNLIKMSKIDEEFKAMVTYYYSLNEWYFDNYKDCESIKVLATIYGNEILWGKIQNMQMRGQMGIYWNSIKRK